MSTERVDFTRGAAERIAAAVRRVEQGDRDQSGPVYPRIIENEGGGGGLKLRLCKTTALFSKGTVATLEVWEAGSATTPERSPAKTLDVANVFVDIPACKLISVARHGNGHYYVVAAEC